MNIGENLRAIRARIDAAAQRAGHAVRLVAVSKTKPAAAIAEMAGLGQCAFGENYVQEALAKQAELTDLGSLRTSVANEVSSRVAEAQEPEFAVEYNRIPSGGSPIEWHMIGSLQSKKAREVAQHFDWLQTLDRAKLIEPLNRLRPHDLAPLQVLIQVNIDDEASKSGCAPQDIDELAHAIAAAPRLALRGLMAIPAPGDPGRRRAAFARMRELCDALRARHPGVRIDTLSMGMSDDFELAIAEGATLVRVGSALFGAR
jgi:pyridoxal phosphate enzyme (YggS family)